MQEDFNCPIRLGDVQVRPGDILVGDINGDVVVLDNNSRTDWYSTDKRQVLLDAYAWD